MTQTTRLGSQLAETILSYDEADAVVREQCALIGYRSKDGVNERNDAGATGRLSGERASCEPVSLDAAQGRVLAEPIIADRDHPPFDRSTRDGFAARAADWSDGTILHVAGLLRAGEIWAGTVEERQAVEIMTGAPLPPGADSVAMVEHVSRTAGDAGLVQLIGGRSISPGDNVVRAGAEAVAGSTLVPSGTRIGFRQVGVGAACGYARVEVYPRPTVAVLATGDELVAVAETPLSHQIRNSNGASLSAQVALAGGAASSAVVPDDRAAIDDAIAAALNSDLILLSGGVSMGRYDFVEEVLAARGAEFFFTGVRMQPGRPVVFGRLPSAAGGWRYFFGLPGNPVSTMVTFALFVAPILRALGGESDPAPVFAMATLSEDLKTGSGLTRFLPAERSGTHAASAVTPIPWQGSGDLAANARANCYIVVPAESASLKSGQVVNILIQ